MSFEEAASVFGDPLAYTFADPNHSIGEHRYLSFGLSHRNRLLAVIHVEHGGALRIVSARIATRHERSIYEQD
ncbi:MAG: BrnT family toxin [Pseudoxanthomonas sp.]